MPGGEAPSIEDISSAPDPELLNLYSDVMGELMARSREKHPDHGQTEDGAPGPLVAVDNDGNQA